MKITAVRTAIVRGTKDWNFVRIETDEGVSGTGEGHPGAGVAALVEERLTPLLIDRDPMNVEPPYHRLLAETTGDSTAGSLVGAIGGVEAALWDLTGRALNVLRGLSLAELERMTEQIAAVREEIGEGVDLCIDCHASYSVRDALLLAERLEPLNLMFL